MEYWQTGLVMLLMYGSYKIGFLCACRIERTLAVQDVFAILDQSFIGSIIANKEVFDHEHDSDSQ